MNKYLLSYNVAPVAAMQTHLVAFVKENRHIQQWSHPYYGLFLLKSDSDFTTLAVSLRSFFTDANSHMLVPINPPYTYRHTANGCVVVAEPT